MTTNKEEDNNNIVKEIQIIEKQLNLIYEKFTIKDCYHSIIEMCPYPSGNLHIGHTRNYTIGDIKYRYHRLIKGKSIRTIGWDAFGLPAENAAKEYGIDTRKWTINNIKNMKEQLKTLGFLYDYTREINTSEYSYYKHTQNIFKIFFENGIIIRDYYFVNWDPVDKTVLANEQVIEGKGWRSGANIELKLRKSWFLNFEQWCEFLYKQTEKLKWPNKIKSIQKNWLGQHTGYVVIFTTKNSKIKIVECFTKEPTEYVNAQFICVGINHKIAIEYLLECEINIPQNEINTFFILTDKYAYNSFNKTWMHIYINAVINNNYGTGAVMYTPTSYVPDQEFADSHQIQYSKQTYQKLTLEILQKEKLVYKKTFYKAKLWCISRQRCWGCPIPLCYCTTCNKYVTYDNQAIDNKRLSFTEYSNLENTQIKVKCKNCNSLCEVVKETLDTFFDTTFYFMKYLIKDSNFTLEKGLSKLPINTYIGGIEHANLHLLYTRIIIKGLTQLLNIKDNIIPFENIINQGLIHTMSYKDETGKYVGYKEYVQSLTKNKNIQKYKNEKMSKSKKNTVDPTEIIKQYSVSALRLTITCNYPIESCYVWSDMLITKSQNFINKFYKISREIAEMILIKGVIHNIDQFIKEKHKDLTIEFDKTIKYIYNMLEKDKFNNYVAGLHILYKNIKTILEKDTISNIIILNYLFINITKSLYFVVPHIADYLHYLVYLEYITDMEHEK